MKRIFLLITIFYGLNASAQSSEAFTFELLRSMEKQKKNILVSPYSIRTILSLCAEGASGKTLSEMTQTLSLPKDATKNRNERQSNINQITNSKGFQISSDNTIWLDKTLLVSKKFTEIAQNYYFAPTQTVDFGNKPSEATKTINDFVAEKTKQSIKNLIPDGIITPLTRMVLTNTIEFKAVWEKEFDKANTKEQDFWLNNTEKKSVKMMYQKGKFIISTYENHKMIELPYKGGEAEMWIILPANNDLPALLSKMNEKTWLKKYTRMEEREVLLTLPLFEFEAKYKLPENLKSMGMNDAFNGNAKFPYLTSNGEHLQIAEIIHQAKIKVEEKGTEAAAATAVIAITRGMNAPLEPFIFKADHPFLFVIQHTSTGEILFAGTVLDPTSK